MTSRTHLDAYIVGAVRTPVGKRGGGLSGLHPADLGATVLDELVRRTGIDPGQVDDVIFGCVDQVGAQANDVARTAWLSAGLPESVPGVTIDRQCGSSQQAVHFAAQAVASGTQDVVVAGGVEVMSLVPISSAWTAGESQGLGAPYDGKGWVDRYGAQEISQFRGAELICDRWGLDRDDLEELALTSHRRAVAATDRGAFDAEIVAVGAVTADEGPRRETTKEKIAGLPTLTPGGRLTAAVASQISDGAAALMVANARAVERHGLVPLARVHTLSVVGSDPVAMLTGVIPATQRALERAGVAVDDIDRFEVNEAFAPVVLAWARETEAALERTNVDGGAIALGHPLGASGARLMTSLVHGLRRSGGRFGLQTMCEGGGQANATVIESLT